LIRGPGAFVQDRLRGLWRRGGAHLVRLYRLALHLQVPHLDGQVVAGHQVAPAVAELHVGDGGDDLGEEGAGGGVLWLLEVYERETHRGGGVSVDVHKAVEVSLRQKERASREI